MVKGESQGRYRRTYFYRSPQLLVGQPSVINQSTTNQMRGILFLGSVLLMMGTPSDANAHEEKWEACNGYTTIDMRVCADIRLFNQRLKLRNQLTHRNYKRWDGLTGELCRQSYEDNKEGTIYPLMLSKCRNDLNEALLENLHGLGERN